MICLLLHQFISYSLLSMNSFQLIKGSKMDDNYINTIYLKHTENIAISKTNPIIFSAPAL